MIERKQLQYIDFESLTLL